MIIVTEWWILYNGIIIAMYLKQYLIKDHGRNGIILNTKNISLLSAKIKYIIFREWIFLHKIIFLPSNFDFA